MRQVGQLYPQSVFGRACVNELRTNSLEHPLLDIPCGRGETTYMFAKAFPTISILGVDIDENRILEARKRYSAPNLEFTVGDIEATLRQKPVPEIGAICVINSLFLFDDPDSVLNGISRELRPDGVFLCVIPNVESSNFKHFQARNPEVNKLILKQDQFSDFFGKHCLRVRSIKGIAFAGTFSWRWTRFVGPLRSQFLNLANALLSLSRSPVPCYYLIVLEKKPAESDVSQ